MIWVFPEYGGQVAVRLGDFKVVRQGLKTKTPGRGKCTTWPTTRRNATTSRPISPT